MAARILIVNGWSNAGKTCFTRWLSKEHGFERVDTDEGEIDTKHLRPFWTKVEQGDATAFKQALHNRAKDTVLDWPYNPPNSFPLVAALQKGGIAVWWFDADPEAAQKSFDIRAQGELANKAQASLWLFPMARPQQITVVSRYPSPELVDPRNARVSGPVAPAKARDGR